MKKRPSKPLAHKTLGCVFELPQYHVRKTDHAKGRWTVVEVNDRRKARLAIIRHVLAQFDYQDRDKKLTRPDEETARKFTR